MGEYEIEKGGGKKTGNQQVGRSRDRILKEVGRWMWGGGGGMWKKGSGSMVEGERASEEGKGPQRKKGEGGGGKCGLQRGGKGGCREGCQEKGPGILQS